jgi:hypothetical protein
MLPLTVLISCGGAVTNSQKVDTQTVVTENQSVDTTHTMQFINNRVEELVKYIPDHKLKPEVKPYFTEDYYSCLEKAFSIPPMFDDMIGDEEFLFYFIEGNGDCMAKKHKIVPLETRVEKSSAYEKFEYYHSDNEKDTHEIKLKFDDNQWIIDDWDNNKQKVADYVNKNYRTKDLAFAEVCGDVRSVIYSDSRNSDYRAFYFDENGNLTKFVANTKSDVPENKVKRNQDGFIISVEDGVHDRNSFTYDTQHLFLKSQLQTKDNFSCELQYSFNNNYEPQVLILQETNGDESIEGPFVINYLDTDSHGNWLKRSYSDVIQERRIEYYQK